MNTRHYYSTNFRALDNGTSPGRLTVARLPGRCEMDEQGHKLLWTLYEEAYGGNEAVYRVYAEIFPEEPPLRPAWIENAAFEKWAANRIAEGESRRWQDYQ